MSNFTETVTTSIPPPVKDIHDVLIYWHEACYEHAIENHPEQPDRVATILAALRENFPASCFLEAPLVLDEQVLLFHTLQHLSMFKRLCDKAEKGPPNEFCSIDSDTTVMAKTRQAAYRAAGSIVAAVDAVYSTDPNVLNARTAFCCVRPPGHHAERNKACGFCFLSNAAIGARYAQDKYGIKKVAVIDFDVHHGNGTEEGFIPDETLFYGSTHELDNFPGTGRDPSPYVGEKAKKRLHRRIVNRTLNAGPPSVKQFHTKWTQVIEEMILFAPDLVIISAGFDAHDEDPLANVELLDEDFQWATEVVMQACVTINPEKPVPVLSILEGGYDLKALASSALAHVKVLAAGYPSPTPIATSSTTVSAAVIATTTASIDGDDDDDDGPSKHGGDEAAALAEYIKGLNL